MSRGRRRGREQAPCEASRSRLLDTAARLLTVHASCPTTGRVATATSPPRSSSNLPPTLTPPPHAPSRHRCEQPRGAARDVRHNRARGARSATVCSRGRSFGTLLPVKRSCPSTALESLRGTLGPSTRQRRTAPPLTRLSATAWCPSLCHSWVRILQRRAPAGPTRASPSSRGRHVRALLPIA